MADQPARQPEAHRTGELAQLKAVNEPLNAVNAAGWAPYVDRIVSATGSRELADPGTGESWFGQAVSDTGLVVGGLKGRPASPGAATPLAPIAWQC